MGEPKLLLEHAGKTLLEQVIGIAKPLSERVVVVVGAYAELYRAEALRCGAFVTEAEDWRAGQGASLRAGVRALPAGVSGCLVLLGDQPFVTPTHLKRLLSTAAGASGELVFSAYDGAFGPPLYLGSNLFEKATKLEPRQNAKPLLSGDPVTVPLADWQDIDTPEDAKRLLE